MQYNAIVLSDSYHNGRSSGMLETVPGTLLFKDPQNNSIRMPVKGINMRIGGAGNRYVFFSHPQMPGITIYTDDRKILKSDDIRFDADLQPLIRQLSRRKSTIWTVLIALAGLFVCSLVLLYTFRGQIVERLAALVPPQQEQSISETMLESATAGKKILRDSSVMERLSRITAPLIQAVNDTAFHFSFTIIQDKTLNAFALPGGAVVIHSGLIEKADNAEEVAGVLAHELSHVTRRHHLRGIIGNMGIFFIIRGLLGDIAGISGDIATAGATLSSLKYSRDFEREADDNGMLLLKRAGIRTEGMISFFKKLEEEGGDMGPADFLSTHPATAERIERLQKQKGNSEGKTLPIDFNAFKQDISNYFNTNKQ